MTEPTPIPDDPFATCVYCGAIALDEPMRPHLTPAGLSTRWLECANAEACRARIDDCVCLYYRTSATIAQDILSHGFNDASVPLSDSPASALKQVADVTILEVTIDHRSRLTPYEHTPDDRWFRTWLVPAYLISSHGQVRRLTDDEPHDAYIDARSRAEDATAEMFGQADQEAAEAWETEQTIDLDDLLANGGI